MSTIADAETGDIYADPAGKLWRVVGVCREPTVIVEEVEPSGHTSDPPETTLGSVLLTAPALVGSTRGQFIRRRQSGGVAGLMWDGFRRIFRPETQTP